MTQETNQLVVSSFDDDPPKVAGHDTPENRTDKAFDSPGEFERLHHELLERQTQQSDQEGLVEEVCAFVVRAQKMGTTLSDARTRQHFQSVLDYWSLFVYRAARIEIDSDLWPYDPNLAPSLQDDRFPYQFDDDAGGRAQRLLGWRRLLDECERDLAGDHLLAVMCEAGAGVRVLVDKLLVPSLRSGKARLKQLLGSENWRYYTLPLGGSPVIDVLRAIAAQEGHNAQWIAQQEESFRRDRTTLRRILSGPQSPAVLMFKRFGSLLQASHNDRMTIVDNLNCLLQDRQRQFYAIATLRRDQTNELSKFGPLEARIRGGHVRLDFTTAELRHLIEEPARLVGLVFEPGLVDQILIDIQGEPTALPLLQFTLSRLWKLRELNQITWKAYQKTGAGRTALRKAMEEVYENLTEPQKITLRQILLTMVNFEPDRSFSTCEVSREDLERTCGGDHHVDEVIAQLLEQDLVREKSVDDRVILFMAYSALLTAWPQLVDWLDERRVKERSRLRLEQAADLWSKRAKSRDVLWQGAMLSEARREFGDGESLTTNVRDFLQASESRENARLWMRQALKASAVLACVAVFFAYIGWSKTREALEKQTQRHANAVDSLTRMDLPGTLLWLDASKGGFFNSLVIQSDNTDQQIRKFAQVQLPDLNFHRAAFDAAKDPVENLRDRYKFESTAVSADNRYVATLRSEPLSADKKRFFVEVTSLLNPKTKVVLLNPPPILSDSEASSGSLIFVTVEAADQVQQTYLIAAAAGLHAWKVQGADAEKWQGKSIAPPGQLTSNVNVAGGKGSLLMTIEGMQNRRSLRLWNLSLGAADDTLKLDEVNANLEGLDGKTVQLASISPQGHLLAVCGEEKDEATELLAWYKHRSENRWAKASPPEWVSRLASQDPQRLRDWGWILSDGKNWQRSGSWIRAISFPRELNTSKVDTPKMSTRFATACDDGQVLIWSLATGTSTVDGKETLTVSPQFETELNLGTSVFDVAFLTDHAIITGGRDRMARIWDIHAAAEIAPPVYHEQTVTKVIPAGSGRLITTTQHVQRLWRSKNYSDITAPVMARQVVLADDKERIVCFTRGGQQEDKAERRIPVHPQEKLVGDAGVRSAVMSSDGNWIFTTSRVDENGGYAASLRAWASIKSPMPLQRSFQGVPVAAFSLSGEWLAIAERKPQEDMAWLNLWRVSPKDSTTPVETPLLISANDAIDAGSKPNFEPMAISFAQVEKMDVLAIGGKRVPADGAERGDLLIAVRDQDADWRVQWVRTSESQDAYPHEEEVLCLAFSKDGNWLAVGDARDQVKLWNVRELIKKLTDSADGRSIVQEPRKVLKHSSDVETVAFQPRNAAGGDQLVTVSSEGEASVWSMSSIINGKGKDDKVDPDYKLKHDAKILCVAFSADGRNIITGGRDRAACVWDSEQGQMVGIFRHQGPIVQAWILGSGDIMTVSESSSRSEEKEDPRLHVRRWSNSKSGDQQSTGHTLEELAAREVKGMQLEPVRWEVYMDQDF